MTDCPGDHLAAIRAAYDQLAEEVKEIPRVLASYFKELRDKGFTRAEATQLTQELQDRLFSDLGVGME